MAAHVRRLLDARCSHGLRDRCRNVHQGMGAMKIITIIAAAMIAVATAHADTWRGIEVADEDRCSPFDRGDYHHYPSVEPIIVKEMGGRIFSPYEMRYYASTRETDIEHIIAVSEAHDSGMCLDTPEQRKKFANYLPNLTLAGPAVNRHQKSDKDAAEWLPEHNKCWFAGQVIQVRRDWGLTIDRAEADALDAVLADCPDVSMRFEE